MKNRLFFALFLVFLICGIAVAAPPPFSLFKLDDGNLTPVNPSWGLTVGGTNPLSVDTDGDGDADFILGTAAPAAADSTGVAGTVFFADDFIYVCIATDTWVRVALATWP